MNEQTHTVSEFDEIAVSTLRKNDKGNSQIPTGNLFPCQWNCDSAFCAWNWGCDIDNALT